MRGKTATQGESIEVPSLAWHALNIDDVLVRVSADRERGLTVDEARRRLARLATRMFFVVSTAICALVFLALTIDTHRKIPALTNESALARQ